MIRILCLVLLFPILLCSCVPPVDLGPDFDELSSYFIQSVRWQDFQGASKFLSEDERDAFLKQFPRNKDLHMVDVIFERIDLDEELGEAETVMFVEYYMLPSATVKEWRWTQQWRRLEGEFPKGGLWQIESPPPAFP